jgi:hypothetical protein
MEKIPRIIFLFFFIVSANTISASEIQLDEADFLDIKHIVLQPFFTALKNGNVLIIKDYLSEDFYSSYQTLLERNEGYPQFLRDYYRGVEFYPINAVQKDDTVEVNVEITSPDGTISHMELNLKKSVNKEPGEINQGRWKIDRKFKKTKGTADTK